MLYLEDYLELIEHLPQELKDRFTEIRTRDLQVLNSRENLHDRVKNFFASAHKHKNNNPHASPSSINDNSHNHYAAAADAPLTSTAAIDEGAVTAANAAVAPSTNNETTSATSNTNINTRTTTKKPTVTTDSANASKAENNTHSEYDKILQEYENTMKYAEDKIQISCQMHEIMVFLISRLDTELEKFKLELEADHAGITVELEKRSLELDREDSELIDNCDVTASISTAAAAVTTALKNKDRRRLEVKNRHINSNGYPQTSTGRGVGRPRLLHKQNHHQHLAINSNGLGSELYKTLSPFNSPKPQLDASSLNGERNFKTNHDDLSPINFGSTTNHSGLKSSQKGAIQIDHQQKNFNYDPQHSVLGATLASSPSLSDLSSISPFGSINAQRTKIQGQDHQMGSSQSFDEHANPLAAAASQAIAATQQLQQGRRTPSLKASFAVINVVSDINRVGSNDSLSSKHDMPSSAVLANRNALAPMTHDYLVTKSGRPSKRPKHHASHIYSNESPTSISSNNSIFENSESISSADFMENSTNINSISPSSFEFATNPQANNFYQRDDRLYCHCQKESYGEMVACDNSECEIEWFHYGCVGITSPPSGDWFCNSCTKKMSSSNIQMSNNNDAQTKKRGRKERISSSVVDTESGTTANQTTTTPIIKQNQ